MIELRLLGPLEAWDSAQRLPLGPKKQTALLASLLIRRRKAVPIDQLIEDLWDGRPPESARKSIQVYVSNLRKVIGSELLQTRGRAYLLEVASDQVDGERFEELLAGGRTELAEGRAREAARTLRTGLDLWRGLPFGELGYESFALHEVARLEELRLAAFEGLAEAELAGGLAQQAVETLETLAAEHPLRERLRAQLMLALYRCGRHAEALEVYRAGRRALLDGLGLEPSAELQAIQRAILRHDPGLQPEAARSIALPRAQERKLATVLQAELGTLAEDLADPERTLAAFSEYHALLSETLELAGGTVERASGPVLVGIFGVPAAQGDHAARALDAAVAARARLPELTIGVDTGEVVVGRSRQGGTVVTGQALGTAAAFARSAKPGTILIGERTAAAARGAFEFAPAGPGRKRLVRARETAAADRRLERLPFVGRDNELAGLREAYTAVTAGSGPRLIALIGDAGVGKTRLVAELWRALREQVPPPLMRSGRCLAYGQAVTYRPLADVLREHFGLRDGDPAATVLEILRGREILGLTLGLSLGGEPHPLVARDRLQEAWIALLQELVAERPVVLLIEDLHWAEQPLLDLLERVHQDVSGPLLLICTARPEFVERWATWGTGRRGWSAHWLEPLAREEAERLVDDLLGVDSPRNLRALIVERAEGNPFFAEELVASLIDRGLVRRRRDRAGVTAFEPGAELRLPDSIHAVVAARIDLLEPVEKETLQAAAVIGRVFWSGAVRALLGGSELALGPLADRDLVRGSAESQLEREDEYTFKHAVTREVAYASVPRSRRARLHAAFADWLERRAPGVDENASLVAHHLAEAVQPDDADLAWAGDRDQLERLRGHAIEWLERASDLAVGRYEIDDAGALLRRALALGPGGETEVRLWRKLGDASVLKYDGEMFWEAMGHALELTDDPARQAELYSTLADVTATRAGMWSAWSAPDGERVREWIALALERAGQGSPARARALFARAWWSPAGDRRTADIREAGELAERLGDLPLRAYVTCMESNDALAWHRYAEALEVTRRRLELAHQVDNPDDRAFLFQISIAHLLTCGRLGEAKTVVRDFEGLTASLSAHHRVHSIAAAIDLHELVGGGAEVVKLVPAARERIEANLDTPCVNSPRSLFLAAAAATVCEDEGLARELEDEAEALGTEGYSDDLEMPKIRLALLREDLELVERQMHLPLVERRNSWFLSSIVSTYFDALLALGDRRRIEAEAPPYAVPGTVFEPFALRALGGARRDPRLIDRGLARFEALGLEWHAARTAKLVDWY